MAHIPTQALSTSLSLVQGSTVDLRLVPKNPDGSVYDCTGYTTCTMNLFFNRVLSATPLDNFSPTVSGADATGITITVTEAIIDAIKGYIQTNNGWYTFVVDDGTDNINLSYGAVTVGATGL